MPVSSSTGPDRTAEPAVLTDVTPDCLDCMTRWARAHIQAPRPFTNGPRPEECPICHENYDNDEHAAYKIVDVHTCPGHVFGLNCLVDWLISGTEGANTCPMCRGQLFILKGHDVMDDEEDIQEEGTSPRSRLVELYATLGPRGSPRQTDLNELLDRGSPSGDDDESDMPALEEPISNSEDESWVEEEDETTPSSNSEPDLDNQSDAGSTKSNADVAKNFIRNRLITEVQFQYLKSRFTSASVDVATQTETDRDAIPRTLQQIIAQANADAKLHRSWITVFFICGFVVGWAVSTGHLPSVG